ncbi:MAG TPA: tetratricopeptide repeat protein [Pyrinomonadaceae bacterium]|nr:tetratricopeptide repeat protein [Pyrinomonadaceae bacterium]
MIGKTISHYRIVEKLGEGGMGVVYIAEDTLLGRRVAIKMLTVKPGQNEHHFRTRFLREARAVSALSHPHIATIHDYGETKRGQPYIVMELVKGQTLGDLMAKGSMTIARALQIIHQVTEALGEAHRNGIVHRDIKPSNVAIDHRGEVKVLDFGLAKQLNVEPVDATDPERQTLLTSQTQEGTIVGTPLYLSPEQALGAEIDARSDIFAVGSLLYECVSGRPAFDGETRMAICTKVIRDDPVPPSKLNPDVPELVDRIAMKALAKQPAERYQTANDLAADLETALSASGIASRAVPRISSPSDEHRPTGAMATLSDIFRRPRISVGYVVAGVAVVFLIGVGLWWMLRPKPYEPKPEAKRLYDQAVDALRQGAFFKSSKILQQAVLDDDRFALAHARLAEADMELDNSDDAKDQLIRANDLAKHSAMADVDEIRLQAITNTVQRNFAGAVENYRQLVAKVPGAEKTFALADLGRACEKNEQLDKAIESYQQATQANENYAAAHLRLGVALGRSQKYDAAKAALDRADKLFNISNEIEGLTEVYFQRGILLVQQGKFGEAEAQFNKALERSIALENNDQRVRTLQQLSNTFIQAGDAAKARQYSQQATELARASGLENLTTAGLIEIGNSYLLKGDLAEAEKNYTEALRLAKQYKARFNEARALLALGSLSKQKDDPEGTRDYTQRALTFFQQGNYRRQMFVAYVNLGFANAELGNADAAQQTFTQLLQAAQQVGDRRYIAFAHEGLGHVSLDRELWPQAWSEFAEEYKTGKAMDADLTIGYAAEYRGLAAARLGRFDEAHNDFAEALAIAQPAGQDPFKDLLAEATWCAAASDLSEQKFKDAVTKARQAVTLATPDSKQTIVRAKATLGLALANSGQAAAGRKQCEEAVQLARTLRNPLPLPEAMLALAEAALLSGDANTAISNATDAQARFASANQHDSEWRAYVILSRAYDKSGDREKAKQLASQAAGILAALESNWGSENYKRYLTRPDVQELRRYLSN